MKPISEVNGRTSEDLYAIRDLNEDEVQQNNRYSRSSVAMERSGPRLWKTLKLVLSNHLSHKKFQQVLSSVLIPGKHIPGLLHKDSSIASSIMGNDSILTEEEIILMGWKDSGVT